MIMITEKELIEYNKWLMEVWNPNQIYIPFQLDAPRAFLKSKGVFTEFLCGKDRVWSEPKCSEQCDECVKLYGE